MQLCDLMGDVRHKKVWQRGAPELNSQTFRDEVHAVLERNKTMNRLQRRSKEHPDYLIESHADIAARFGMKNQAMIDRVLGSARGGKLAKKLVETSDLIKPIREMLGLRLVEIAVAADRADVLLKIAGLPDKEFAVYRESIEDRTRS